ncbi:invasion associated locus B family protein [Pseudochrobactrum asaccharolyticum]|nr:invasion associated locus B family protein [Pseudochrobactrum asaccharolyticum]
MRNTCNHSTYILVIAVSSFLTQNTAFARDLAPKYFIKSSEVQLPDGVGWGQYKRTIQPFENWTLICDENLKKKEKVCNLSQIISDASGNQVFSWSLAATANGDPFLILRVPANTDQKIPLKVKFSGRDTAIAVAYKGCNETVCIAMMPVGSITREHINKGNDVKFAFTEVSGQSFEIVAPLKGLKSGLAGIK